MVYVWLFKKKNHISAIVDRFSSIMEEGDVVAECIGMVITDNVHGGRV